MREGFAIPNRAAAERLLTEAEEHNPGPWVAHSRNVARAAEIIARQHPGMDGEAAYILGLLHDIGRRAGVTDMRHVIDGYNYLYELGHSDSARICLTHSFPLQTAASASGKWDCSQQEYEWLKTILTTLVYTPYDRLIQLCDCLALPTGFCLIEKRFVDVALRHGFNDYTLQKWRAFLQLQADFEQQLGRSIYALLPGILETTFGGSSPARSV